MQTDLPAAVSASAAVAPPGPEPTTTTSKSGTRHLRVAPTARLHVTRVADRAPPAEVAITAVLRWSVARLTCVLEHELPQFSRGAQTLPPFVVTDLQEVVAQHGDTFAIDLLPAAHRAVPLARGIAT